MAIKLLEDLALMRFYFARSGDAWRHALPLLQQMPVAFEVFELCNIKRLWQNGQHRIPTACPSCGVTRLSRDDNYALVFLGGGTHDISGQLNQPHRITCLACNATIDVLDLLDDLNLTAKERDALLDGAFKKYAPTMSMWVVAESEAGKVSFGRTAAEALNELLGPTFENEQRLCRVECFGLEQAQRLVAEHCKTMAWKTVEIDSRTLEPLDPRWHGDRLLDWEVRRLKEDKVVARILERETIDKELARIRLQRLSELA